MWRDPADARKYVELLQQQMLHSHVNRRGSRECFFKWVKFDFGKFILKVAPVVCTEFITALKILIALFFLIHIIF